MFILWRCCIPKIKRETQENHKGKKPADLANRFKAVTVRREPVSATPPTPHRYSIASEIQAPFDSHPGTFSTPAQNHLSWPKIPSCSKFAAALIARWRSY